jgi:hypothetical protein
VLAGDKTRHGFVGGRTPARPCRRPFGKGLRSASQPIRQQKNAPGEIRTQCLRPVILLKDRRAPGQEVRVCRCEILPAPLAASPFHALVDEKEVCPGDRLVVQARLAVRSREPLQSLGKTRQRRGRRLFVQEKPGGPDMIAMAKIFLRQRARFKPVEEAAVVRVPVRGPALCYQDNNIPLTASRDPRIMHDPGMAGREEDLVARYRIEEYVRWEDIDAAGIINYQAYLRFFALAEAEMLREAGLNYSFLFESLGIWLPRVRVECQFYRPVKLDEL